MLKPLAALAILSLALSPAMADKASRAARDAADIQAGEAQLAKLTKGLVPGKPESCSPQYQWTGSENINRVGILYEYGSRKYLNRMDADCARFDWTQIPVVISHGMTCQGDIVHIVDTGTRFQTGSCTLGPFIPYDKPKPPKG